MPNDTHKNVQGTKGLREEAGDGKTEAQTWTAGDWEGMKSLTLKNLGQAFWDMLPLALAEPALAVMREAYETATKTIQRRTTEEIYTEKCTTCGKKTVKWFNRDVKRDPATGITKTVVFCSEPCYTHYTDSQAVQTIGKTPRPTGAYVVSKVNTVDPLEMNREGV